MGEDREELRELLNCLIEAARKDPLRRNTSHGDGWGLVAYTGNGLLLHYRSGKPIYDESEERIAREFVDMLGGKMWVIVHARRATDPVLIDAIFPHPYLESTPGELIYIAHNGSIIRERLGKGIRDKQPAHGQISQPNPSPSNCAL